HHLPRRNNFVIPGLYKLVMDWNICNQCRYTEIKTLPRGERPSLAARRENVARELAVPFRGAVFVQRPLRPFDERRAGNERDLLRIQPVEKLGRMDGEPEARDFIQEIDARLIELKEVLPQVRHAEKPSPEFPVARAAPTLRQPPVASESLLYH